MPLNLTVHLGPFDSVGGIGLRIRESDFTARASV